MRRLLCCAFCWTTLALAQAPPDPAELARIEAAITRVRAELAGKRDALSALHEQVQAAEQSIVAINRQLETLTAETAALQTQLAGLRAQEAALEASRAEQAALISTYLRSAWMSGRQEYLKLVLNQEDPAQSARMLRYYRYFAEARSERIAAYQATLAALAPLRTDILAREATLAQQGAALATEQAELAASRNERQRSLAALELALAEQGRELEGLESRKLEIEGLLEELRRSIADIELGADQEAFADRKGRLPWPLEGTLANDFGTRHALGDLTWEGVTITAPAGSDIRAVHHGRVVFADWFNTSGLLLIIDHGGGYMSLYAHNQELYKAVGAWVSGGEVIAATGNTGGQREPGLYFEIRRNGRAENPVNWCIPRR